MLRGLIKRCLILASAILLASCAATGPSRSDRVNADSSDAPGHVIAEYQKAVTSMQDGNDERAAERLEQFIANYPQYAGPHVNLGIIYARTDRLEEAEQMFGKAIDRNPRYAAAFNELGILYRQQGEFDKAAAAYQGAIEADPEYALAYLNIGVLYDLYQRQPQQALEYYEQYLAMEQDELVERWIAELQLRIAAKQRSARAGEAE